SVFSLMARSIRSGGLVIYVLMFVDASTVVNAWRSIRAMTTSLPRIAADAGVCCAPVTGGVLAVEDAQRLARMVKALGDPARLRFLWGIAVQSGGVACVRDPTEAVGLSLPTAARPMKPRGDARLVTREQRGKWAYHARVPEILSMLSSALDPQALTDGGR